MNDRVNVEDLSAHDIRLFIESPIWHCIKADLDERLNSTDELIRMAPVDDIWGEDEKGIPILSRMGVRKLQGAAIELMFVLNLPQSYLDELEVDKEEQNATTPD